MSERPVTITLDIDCAKHVLRALECEIGSCSSAMPQSPNSEVRKWGEERVTQMTNAYVNIKKAVINTQPEREEAAAREFADGWRDAEIARLNAEIARLKGVLKMEAGIWEKWLNTVDTQRFEVFVTRPDINSAISIVLETAYEETTDSEPDHK